MSTKRCGKCREVKPEAAFNRAGEGRQHWCRECFRAYFRARGQLHLEQVVASKKARQKVRRQLLDDHLRRNPCADCGETDIGVLEFDHVDDRLKEWELSVMWIECHPIDAIQIEIGRCEVVCRNCHRRRTAHRAGWSRLGDEPRPSTTRRPRQTRNVAWLYAYLRAHPCIDCGNADPVVLDFDHVGQKRRNVTAMAWGEYSLRSIQMEVAECEVRCANCHRRVTAQRRAAARRPR